MRRATRAQISALLFSLASGAGALSCATGQAGSDPDAAREAAVDDAAIALPEGGLFANDDAAVDPDAGLSGGSAFEDAGEHDAGEESPPCEGRAALRGDLTVTLPYRGLVRTALVHVPASYDPTRATALVLNFHGFSSDALQQSVYTQLNRAAEPRGVIAVHPYGVASSWNAGQCCGTAWLDAVDDVGFVRALLDRLEAQLCVDRRRVFAMGMSNGGFLSHRLACEVSDRIAAIAPVAGVLGVPPAGCTPARPVPVLQIHGTEDPLVPYRGGYPVLRIALTGDLNFRSVAETMAHWRDRNGCTGASQIVYRRGDATCERSSACREGGDVVLCTLGGGGHTWPGAALPVPFLGATSHDLDATNTALDFFAAHPMP